MQRYLDILEQTFIIRRLPPFFENVGKRLTKAPKIYIRDTGLLHHLLNIASLKVLDAHPAHPFSQAYFWRTHAGAEIDLLLDRGNRQSERELDRRSGAGRTNLPQPRALPQFHRRPGLAAALRVLCFPHVSRLFPALVLRLERRGLTVLTGARRFCARPR